ncbi:MAG: tryptophan--tRNA ligase [Alphaproteobacteria bacterium]
MMSEVQSTAGAASDAGSNTDEAVPYQGPDRVFSGVQPTGNLHLGNYLGAIRRFVAMQETHDCLYCVVDMHAITVFQDPADLRHNIRELTAAFLACGLDAERSVIFNQSQVPEHAELAWIFNCVARFGWMNRMTQFKEKSGKHKENASLGLFAYPALMAADILVYKGTHVPVGEDQKQHVELARDIAQKFNNDFAAPAFFPQPEPLIQGPATRVMSLRDGTSKMSKSDASDFSRINLIDDADAIAQKVRKAKTDPEPLPETAAGLAERPEARNLVGIYAALSDKTPDAVLADFAGKPFSEFKPALADLLVETMGPIGAEIRRLMADPAEIDRSLSRNAVRAREIASPIMAEVRDLVGFIGCSGPTVTRAPVAAKAPAPSV